ncbi:Nucleotide-binding universal stress protein, UspA family [Flavobacterium fluvii]|uniref:Nucleotide-binding universal stress protein, UspA family n=1 Tax=Flavobacterium fluvii TaxID=468056 RepID=A0A1M5DZA9_9FLAO|nr:universal stress protein [Flavobacterium fluvii]SHF72171.1 Nucleotide-binding universal stress protein, UspA family [Flavobacterium fluvii]
MKRILVPTDFSIYSKEALKLASQIARKHDSEIILLHMLELPHQGSDPMGGGKTIPEIMLYKEMAISNLEELMDSDYLKGINVSEAVEFKSVHKGILDSCEKNNVDLIIMGSHGTSGFDELLIGSNAEKVVRYSKIPVLVVKKEAKDFKAKNFVFASDFSKETRKPFRKMLEFAKIFDSNLYLVMISTPNSFKTTHDAERIIRDFVANYEIENYSTHLYNDTNIENGIINFANTVDADLIGICTHGRTGLSHFFNGSIGEELVNHALKPVITFKI